MTRFICGVVIQIQLLIKFAFFIQAQDYLGGIIIPDHNKGDKRVVILKADANWDNSSSILWEWKVDDQPYKKNWNGSMLDAKRVIYKNKVHVLITSQSAIALIELSSKKTLYLNTQSGNQHSSTLIPDGYIAAADPDTSKLKIFDMSKGNNTPPIHSFSHSGVHGTQWDEANKIIWGWGGNKMQGYSYKDGNFSSAWWGTLPSSWNSTSGGKAGGGHSFAPKMDEKHMTLFSYNGGLGTFQTKTHDFKQYTQKNGHNTKGISYNPKTKELIYCFPDEKASGFKWKTNYVSSLSHSKRTMDKGAWYRVRWFQINNFSYPEE